LQFVWVVPAAELIGAALLLLLGALVAVAMLSICCDCWLVSWLVGWLAIVVCLIVVKCDAILLAMSFACLFVCLVVV